VARAGLMVWRVLHLAFYLIVAGVGAVLTLIAPLMLVGGAPVLKVAFILVFGGGCLFAGVDEFRLFQCAFR
jgi:hypothetical protein